MKKMYDVKVKSFFYAHAVNIRDFIESTVNKGLWTTRSIISSILMVIESVFSIESESVSPVACISN